LERDRKYDRGWEERVRGREWREVVFELEEWKDREERRKDVGNWMCGGC
jgi:hypothetical protein